MRELFFFAVGASIVGTVFFVSLAELIYTIRRRKVHEDLEARLQEFKTTYTESMNKLVSEDESKIEAAEKIAKEASSTIEKEKEAITKEYQAEIEELQANSEKALASAKARAKKLEEEAKLKAEEYLNARKKEVEQELMDLVIAVTKKVLPAGISYETQKDLVLKALQDVKAEAPPAWQLLLVSWAVFWQKCTPLTNSTYSTSPLSTCSTWSKTEKLI